MKNIKYQNYLSILLLIGFFCSCNFQSDEPKIVEKNSNAEEKEFQFYQRTLFAPDYKFFQSDKEKMLDTLNEINIVLYMDILAGYTRYVYWVCENNGVLTSKSIAVDMFFEKIPPQPYVQKIPIKKINIEKFLTKHNFFNLPKFDISYDNTFIEKHNVVINPEILIGLDVNFAEKNNSILRYGDYKRIDEAYSLELFNDLFSLLKCPCPYVTDVFNPRNNEGCQEVYYNDFEKDYPMILPKDKWLNL